MKNVNQKLLAWLIVVSIELSACNSIPGKAIPSESFNSTDTQVPTITINTFTPITTPTVIPSPTETTTPISTLLPEKANAYVLDLLRTNGNCDFPCWWGILPGQSSWGQTQLFLRPFALSISRFPKSNGNIKYEINFPDPEGRSWNKRLTAFVYVNNVGNVEMMSVPVQQSNLRDILRVYGVPTEVWIDFIGDFPGGTLEYSIAIYYQDKGIMAIPGGLGHEVTHGGKKYLKMCSDEFGKYSQLWLWSPQAPKTFYDIAFALDLTSPGEMGFGRIGNVTNLNEAEFYNEFSSDTNSCFETAFDVWPIISPSP